MVYGGSTACHGVNLVLDLDVKVLKDLAFLYNSFLFLSVFFFKTSVDVSLRESCPNTEFFLFRIFLCSG